MGYLKKERVKIDFSTNEGCILNNGVPHPFVFVQSLFGIFFVDSLGQLWFMS